MCFSRFLFSFLLLSACSTQLVRAEDNTNDKTCGVCTEYGGFRDPSAMSPLGVSCNMLWLASAPFTFFSDTCEAFDSSITAHSCCNDPPVPDCPLCGHGSSFPNPERLVPGTTFSCRNLQAFLEFSVTNFGHGGSLNGTDDGSPDDGLNADTSHTCAFFQARSVANLCCQPEEPTEMDFCAICPDGGIVNTPFLAFGENEDSCTSIILTQLEEDPNNCPDVDMAGCCNVLPDKCPEPEAVCDDPASYTPDNVVGFTSEFLSEGQPSCAEFMHAYSIFGAGDCTAQGFVDLSHFCCGGAAECFVCLGGGEVADEDRTLSFAQVGATCGNVNEALGGLPAESCTPSELEIDLDGYCGCPNAAVEPPSLCSVCGGEPVPDPTFVTSTGATCGEAEAVAPWLVPSESCGIYIPTWDNECCNRMATTPATTTVATMLTSTTAESLDVEALDSAPTSTPETDPTTSVPTSNPVMEPEAPTAIPIAEPIGINSAAGKLLMDLSAGGLALGVILLA